MTRRRLAALLPFLSGRLLGQGARSYVYVGDLGADFALIAWGQPSRGGNSVGRTSDPIGRVTLKIGDRTVEESGKNWSLATGLQPDMDYPYEVLLEGKRIGGGQVRTYPVKADRLCFFVIGDWGTGDRLQRATAQAMVREWEARKGSANPPRFVLSTGDNIYGEVALGAGLFRGKPFRRTGDADADWEPKFFEPYEGVLAHIPFHPVPGNHDGNDTEARGDLNVYLDNFFFPGQQPARWYRFGYAGLADFFALDSTRNSVSGPPEPVFSPGGAQDQWLRRELPASTAPWKIPFFHHPPFNAGPFHASSIDELRHFVELFTQQGVRVAFNGHEHNFQFTEVSPATYNIRFVVSGSGGELRAGDVKAHMAVTHTAGWAAQNHFCIVEIEGRRMQITPVSYTPMDVRDRTGNKVGLPVSVELA